MTKSSFLRTLRSGYSLWALARSRLESVRALADTLGEPPELSSLEAEEAAARARYEAHAALDPELAAEFADRAELAETLTALQKTTRQLDALRHRPPGDPGELPADLTTPGLIHEASTLDAAYRAAMAEPEPNWSAIGTMEVRAAKLRDRIAAAEARHARALARHAKAAAAHNRHAAEVMLLTQDADRLRAYAHTLRQRLPLEPRAPLREPRRRYRAPAPGELRDLIRARYSYDPATDTLRREPAGTVVHAPQSLTIEGHRIPRAQVVAALFDPESIA